MNKKGKTILSVAAFLAALASASAVRAEITVGDQSGDPDDIRITREIRQTVMEDSALSFTAKNAKIITAGRRVTLKGIVPSGAEKEALGRDAERAAGAGNVVNEIEVRA
ncbi:MAG TPA: BON domain-containing protein [Candidatus Eisenbacteria bacterium]|nr:BON domain-containing protein [Candidatus Eisenbacteria bacterium]